MACVSCMNQSLKLYYSGTFSYKYYINRDIICYLNFVFSIHIMNDIDTFITYYEIKL